MANQINTRVARIQAVALGAAVAAMTGIVFVLPHIDIMAARLIR